jgi:hypothetical protein
MITVEKLLTSKAGFGITTATAVQRAGARVVDGRPLRELRAHLDVVAAFGGPEAIAELPSERGIKPAEFYNVASPRTAKTSGAVAAAIVATQTVDVSGVGPGEVPRCSILSLTLDVADVPFRRLVGVMQSSKVLRPLLLEVGSDSVLVRHPSGKPVEIACVAGSRAAGQLVARWSVGLIADEATRMASRDEAVANLDDALSAIRERQLPGAQIQGIGSPHAPFGPMYEIVGSYFGKPTEQVVVMRTTGPAGNPKHWTEERLERLRERDESAWRIVALGEFLDPETGLLSPVAVRKHTREEPLELSPIAGGTYFAACDPSEGQEHGNAWTLVIVQAYQHDDRLPAFRVVCAKEYRGLGVEGCIEAMAEDCQRYGVRDVETDRYAAGANQALARRYRLRLQPRVTTPSSRLEDFTNLAQLIHTGRVELSPDRTLRRDLLGVKKRVTQTGVTIHLPKTRDGRHSDFAPALAAAVRAAAGGAENLEARREIKRVNREATPRKHTRNYAAEVHVRDYAAEVAGVEPLDIAPGMTMYSNGLEVVVGHEPSRRSSYDSFCRRPGRESISEQLRRSGF